MHYSASIFMVIYAYMLPYICIYAYIDVFWLLFGLILHYCSPRGGESPMNPRELPKTAKYKCNIGQILQHSASALHLEGQSNRRGRRECKAATKKSNDYKNMLEKIYLFYSCLLHWF